MSKLVAKPCIRVRRLALLGAGTLCVLLFFLNVLINHDGEESQSLSLSGMDARNTSVQSSEEPAGTLVQEGEGTHDARYLSVDDVSARRAPSPPLPSMEEGSSYHYERTETLESWQWTSDGTCAAVALEILEDIQQQTYELTQAGFMDISGECWGCVFTTTAGEVCMVTLIPLEPFSTRSSDNPLAVSILHYFEPEVLK